MTTFHDHEAAAAAPAIAPGGPLVGAAAFVLLAANTLLWCTLLFLLALAKLVLPFARLRTPLDRSLNRVATRWVAGNSTWMRLTQKTRWDIAGSAGFDRDRWYLVTCNHQSWVDIFVLQRVLNRRIPLLKFFLKRELIYVPVMGLAWWALDFPFMKRRSRKGAASTGRTWVEDAETSRRACAKFARVPTSVMNFVEGTRATAAKQAAQRSPYRHLLKPRTGALAASLETLGEKFTTMLDVTIVYPGGVPSFWDFLCARVPDIVVRYRELPLPRRAPDAPESEGESRTGLARWLSQVWAEKDAQIDAILAGTPGAPGAPASSAPSR